MICFIQESLYDYLMYYPIIKELENKHIQYSILNLSQQKTATDIFLYLSTIKTPITSTVIYGVSPLKLLSVLLLKESGSTINFIEGSTRLGDHSQNPQKNSNFMLLSALATTNFVSTDSARMFLINEGIKSPIYIFECPITHLCRKFINKSLIQENGVLIVSDSQLFIDGATKQSIIANIPYEVYSEEDKPDLIYRNIAKFHYILSDNFIFDIPARNLGKHFFYAGDEVSNLANLGITTHVVLNRKKEIHDFLEETWTKIEPINTKYGLQSLIQVLT